MAAENARIAIVLSRDDRAALKNYYGTICGTAVIYENPTQTIVVLREGWRRVPDFTTRYTPRHPTVVYTMKRAGKEGAGTAFGPDK